MKANIKIIAGTILVCIKTQSTGCGIKYCKKGSVVKCADNIPEYSETVTVFRNEREEKKNKWFPVNRDRLRLATPEESLLYVKGKHFLEEVEAD